MSVGMTPLSLLQRLQEGRDDDAWHRLDRLYRPWVLGWLVRQGVSEADAEDLGQEVFSVVHRRLAEFDHSGRVGAFRTWLRTITIHYLKGYWRKRLHGVARRDEVDLAGLADPDDTLERLWDREHDTAIAQRLMLLIEPEFSPATWRAFRRQVLDGEKADRVSAEMGLSVNAVLIAKSRVLRRLRQEGAGLIDVLS
ncbi:MAG: sigma-70 family RNA polymerase sigma factor [Isosphaeraceae bacterium]